jgi:tetratricopeptide (TPR) repeat protein
MGGYAISALAGDHATAGAIIDRALTLNPNSAHAWMAKGLVSCFLNRPEPAIEAFERAMRLSPLDPLGHVFTWGLALAHFIAGRYEQSLELQPGLAIANFKRYAARFLPPEHVGLYVEGLRKAGLPEE